MIVHWSNINQINLIIYLLLSMDMHDGDVWLGVGDVKNYINQALSPECIFSLFRIFFDISNFISRIFCSCYSSFLFNPFILSLFFYDFCIILLVHIERPGYFTITHPCITITSLHSSTFSMSSTPTPDSVLP